VLIRGKGEAGVWPDPFGFAGDVSPSTAVNSPALDDSGELNTSSSAGGEFSSTKRTSTGWRAAQAAVRQGVALHVIRFIATMR